MNNHKNFTETINQLSLLYELSLAIGKSLNLKDDADMFLKTLMARKNLAFASIWIKNEYLPDKKDKEFATLVYANPELWIDKTIIPLHHPCFTLLGEKEFISIGSSDDKFHRIITEKRIEKGVFIILRLNNLGILKLFSMVKETPFKEKEVHLLKNIIHKFAISLEGCLSYQRRKLMEEELIKHRDHLEELVKKRTESLQESEEKFRLAFEGARDAIFWADVQTGLIIKCNKEAEILLEKTKEEIEGHHQRTVHPPEKAEYFAQMFKKHIKHKGWLEDEAEVITKSGKIIPVLITASVVIIGERPIIQGIFHDITVRKELQKKIIEAEKFTLMSQLAAEAAHEIKNPLQVITAGLYYLKTLLPQQEIEGQEVIQKMNNALLRATDFINDLLNITRPVELKKDKVNITNLIKTAISEISEQKLSGIDVQLHLTSDLPEIKADFNRLKQVIVNFVKNAIESMEEVTGKQLKLSSEIEGNFLKISVSDTGKGISKEDIGKIFDPFYTTRAKGVGLGLVICSRYIEAHQGKIEVESEVGVGTTFSIYLPKDES